MKELFITSPESRAALIDKLQTRLLELSKVQVDPSKYVNESRNNQMNALRIMILHLQNKNRGANIVHKEKK